VQLPQPSPEHDPDDFHRFTWPKSDEKCEGAVTTHFKEINKEQRAYCLSYRL